MGTARNRVVEHTPGPNPEIDLTDWRATVNGTPTADQATVASFWSKVNVGRPGVCWEWRAARNEFGYGIFRRRDVRLNIKAHRMAWQLFHGEELSSEVKLLHSCDNPPCVNPAHLRTGTQGENVADMHSRGRRSYESRYTSKDIAGMRDLSRQGLMQSTIAALYGCSQSYVSMIVNGQRGASKKGPNNGR